MFTPLCRSHGDGEFELMEPVKVRIAAGIAPLFIIVPAGFHTDFASIPTGLHWFVRPSDRHIQLAAIVHDWCYSTHVVSRRVADALFYQLMRENGMRGFKAKICLQTVMRFGKHGYLEVSPDRMAQRTPELFAKHYTHAPTYEGTDPA